MKKSLGAMISALVAVNLCVAQPDTLKESAKVEFRMEHYSEAIDLLKQATRFSPDDPELYYLLGVCTHYNAYDSRPLAGYDDKYSQTVFSYLDKALSLNPEYGDARYFYGAECSADAFIYMQRYQSDKVRMICKKAYERGAYPDWLIEFGRNLLNNCDSNAILFAGGNPDFDVCLYLQLHQAIRTDITIIPVGFIDRPFYVSVLKGGLPGIVRRINIGLTDEQIQNIRPYKWDTTIVKIPISEPLVKLFRLPARTEMEWLVCPDLTAYRQKQNNPAEKRTFLSPQRAMLLEIVEANKWERPICFSNATDVNLMGGLDQYLQNCGLVSRVLPVKTDSTKWKVDVMRLEKILSEEHYRDFPTVLTENLPRISGITALYYQSFISLAMVYKKNGNSEGLKKVTGIFEKKLKIGFNKEIEEQYYRYLKFLNTMN